MTAFPATPSAFYPGEPSSQREVEAIMNTCFPLQVGRAAPVLCVLLYSSVVSAQQPSSATATTRQPTSDVVRFAAVDACDREQIDRAVQWLRMNTVSVKLTSGPPLHVIAWKDPTLAADDSKLLAGYLSIDTLWGSRALQPFYPADAKRIDDSLDRLGHTGNGLHEVLFRPVYRLLHAPADIDYIHGSSIGHYATTNGLMVDLRVFSRRSDAAMDVGHPQLFTEHAVFEALNSYWHGQRAEARDRILECIRDDRANAGNDKLFWDSAREVLVDHVSFLEAEGRSKKSVWTVRNYTFKLGLLLYAVRFLRLEAEVGDCLSQMHRRLWQAQCKDGGLAHFIEVDRNGNAGPALLPATGEATAIAILAHTIVPGKSHE